MATSFYRGSTPTIRFTPKGASISELGTPIISITQELAMLSWQNTEEESRIVFDTDANSISVTLTEAECLQLAEGLETQAQVVWYRDAEEEGGEPEVLRYPVHELTVLASIMEEAIPSEDEEPVPEVPDDSDLVISDPVGSIDDGGGSDTFDYDVEDYQEFYDDTLQEDPADLELYPEDQVAELDTTGEE